MRPIKGIVVHVGDTDTKIQLSYGGVIIVPNAPELERGTKVEVDLDRTRNKARAVWLRDQRPNFSEPKGEPVDIADFGEAVNKGMRSRTFTSPTFDGVRGSKE